MGMLSLELVANNGIIAGATAATYELKAYLLQSVMAFEVSNPLISLVVHIGDLFIDRAQVARARSRVVRGVRTAAQVAEDRIIGLGRAMRRHRRDPREKELQDQHACHLAHAKASDAKLGNAIGRAPPAIAHSFPFPRAFSSPDRSQPLHFFSQTTCGGPARVARTDPRSRPRQSPVDCRRADGVIHS